VKHDKDGRVSVEMYSAADAASKIRQAHGAYGAKGTPEDPVHTHQHVTVNVVNAPRPEGP
jgi:hypothetical protein